MSEQRAFKHDTVYTTEEIRRAAPSAYEWDDGEGQTFLIAQAEREYWFLPEGEGWKVDHTWSSFTLIGKDEAQATLPPPPTPGTGERR